MIINPTEEQALTHYPLILHLSGSSSTRPALDHKLTAMEIFYEMFSVSRT